MKGCSYQSCSTGRSESPQLGKIVRRCLAKEPEHRYQSTDDLRHDLRELKEESESCIVRFDPDGRSISYLTSREGADELWSVRAQGGEPRRLARFEGKEISDFAWSPDGSRLAVVKVSRSGDVVLLKRVPA